MSEHCREGHRGRWFSLAALALAVLWLGTHLAHDIDRPWTGSLDYDGAIWSQAAHNNLRAGLGTTLGVASSWHFGPLPIPPQGYYTHHPPGLPLLVTAAFALVGESEAAARMVAIAHGLAALVLLWLLVRSAAGACAAAGAALVFALLPMNLYVGRMVHFECPSLCWTLAALLALGHWERTASARAAAASLACFVVAMGFSWYAYLLAASTAAVVALGRRPGGRRFALLLLLCCLVAFALFLLHISMVRPDAVPELVRAYLFRSGGAASRGGTAFGMADWLGRQHQYFASLIGMGPALLAIAGAGIAIRSSAGSAARAALRLAAIYASATLAYLTLFRNGSYIHSFWGFNAGVAVAIAAGAALAAIGAWAAGLRPGARAVVSVLTVLVPGLLAWRGAREVRALHAWQYRILDDAGPEPSNLIPALGRALADALPEAARVLSNLPHRGPQLRYYAQRPIRYDLVQVEDWSRELARRRGPAAGLIWLGGPGATDLVAALPAGQRRQLKFGEHRFLLWQQQKR